MGVVDVTEIASHLYMDNITATIYNDITLNIKVYKKPLTGLGSSEGDFKPYYSLCIGGTESQKAFSHSEFGWSSGLMNPSSDQPYSNRDFIQRFKPGHYVHQGGSGYEHSGTQKLPPVKEMAREMTGALAAHTGEAARGAVDTVSSNVSSRLKSMRTRRRQTDQQILTRATEYLDFFKSL